ncbi:hypothetical protein ACHAXT_010612 [Thalassiosira profunda]
MASAAEDPTNPGVAAVGAPRNSFKPIEAAAAAAAHAITSNGAAVKTVASRVSLSPDFTTEASLSTAGKNASSASLSSGVGEEKKEGDDEVEYLATKPAAKPAGAFKPAKSNAAAASPRRTGRKRTATTMVIDGHVVKTINNYTVTEREYIHGAYTGDAPKPKKAKPAQPKSAKPKSPRKQPAYVTARNKHNAHIKQRVFGEDEAKRFEFMARHSEALAPFVDDKVQAQLQKGKGKVPPETEEVVLGSQPDSVTTTLRDYQMIGLDWMAKMHSKGMPFVLGDEMGLGKTLQTIALICHLKENMEGFSGPSLVICPLSVLYSWCNEVEKHAPSLKCFRFHSSDPAEREVQKNAMLQQILDYDIVVTTYEMAKNPAVTGLINRTYFNLCVLDEGHVIKSLTSQIGAAVRKIHAGCRVILTGTPLQNNLVELYAILNYLYPQYFTTAEPFEDAFDITHNRIDPGMLLKANKLLKLFMIRRLKDEVEKLMPRKIETKILCPLSSSQVFWYKGFLMNEIEGLVKLTDAGEDDEDAMRGKGTMLRNLIIQLRKVCLHPYLFDFAEASIKDTSCEELVATSGKLAVLDKLLRSLFKNGHRTCIFSQFVSMLNIIEDYCILRGWKYCRFDGGTPRAQRNHIINQFNAPNSDTFIFLMSTRSGGLGLNLQTADTCILYDSDWNPQPDLQAMARVHRIGQKKTVHVYRLLCGGTIEERMVERAEKKLYLDQMVNRGATNKNIDEEGGGLSTADLLATLKFGSNAVFSSANDLPTDKDMGKVTDRTRSEEDGDGGILKGGVAKTASDFETNKELTDTRNFCGVDFRKLREEKEAKMKGPKGPKFLDNLKDHWKEAQTGVAPEELGKGKRNRKSRLLQIEGNGSGYGASHVPVLAMNNYGLLEGEPSAWGRETKKWKSAPQKKKKEKEWVNQDFCQMCGDGGMLIECPSCPVSLHSSCCGLTAKDFASCSHHRCVSCNKSSGAAGGLLYRCESCINAYCPDCMKGELYRYLGICPPRFEKLNFHGNALYQYIHCSKQCEEVAKIEFGYSPEKSKPKCPPAMDVAYAFGKDAMDPKDMAKMFKEKAMGVWDKKKSPPRVPGSRVSPRKRSPTAVASAAGGVVDLTSPAGNSSRKPRTSPRNAGTVFDISYSPNPSAKTGYI